MQQTIADRAAALQFAIDDVPGDALETLLDAILAAASDELQLSK